MHLEISSAKCCPFHSGPKVLKSLTTSKCKLRNIDYTVGAKWALIYSLIYSWTSELISYNFENIVFKFTSI